MSFYIFEDSLNKKEASYCFYSGGKWREDCLNPKIARILYKIGQKTTKFGFKVSKVNSLEVIK